MNIAIDIRCLMDKKLTGVGEYAFNLLDQLFKIDQQNQYYLFFNSHKKIPHFPIWQANNIHYCEFKFSNKLFNIFLMIFQRPRLDKIIEKKYNTKIDLFFFPNLNFIKTKCPYIITMHDLSFIFLKKCFAWESRVWHQAVRPAKTLREAKKIIAVSKNTKNNLQKIFNLPADKIIAIHSGISCLSSRPEPVRRSGGNLSSTFSSLESLQKKIKHKYQLPSRFILFLGTIEPRKNIITLIDAFEKFNQQSARKYDLVIAGKRGWLTKQFDQHIKNKPDIQVINYVDQKDKPVLYSMADLFVYPSLYEGFGFPPLEAMACKCPVITAHNSSLTEICEDAAIYVDPFNINDLVRALNLVLNNPDKKHQLISAGLTQSAKFTWQKTAENFQVILSKTEGSNY